MRDPALLSKTNRSDVLLILASNVVLLNSAYPEVHYIALSNDPS